MTRSLPVAMVLAAALTLSACSGTKSDSGPASGKPAAAPSAAQSATDAGLTGEEFMAKVDTLSGTVVTLGRCSLLTTPSSDGSLACRVLDKQGADIKDVGGLPVDIFIKPDDLSSDDEVVVAECGGFCEVQITGKLARATDGTGYLSMTDVDLQPLS